MLTDLKSVMKNRAVVAVLTSLATVLGTAAATAYPEIYRAVCMGGLV